jgi:hypothetical protein
MFLFAPQAVEKLKRKAANMRQMIHAEKKPYTGAVHLESIGNNKEVIGGAR